jgi:hypothetical protein
MWAFGNSLGGAIGFKRLFMSLSLLEERIMALRNSCFRCIADQFVAISDVDVLESAAE